ncbi:hypothetical protein [Haloferula rosea]|uniref:Uncharacterized protein n=1 Tax=Haloferula rosea TaxID=490093 RepID=A0A934RE29_9BACT|nr:hypothetical protein [Haloferula rosea]MBK1827968.1 hypothetical protein [Haloferula rosea]
MRKYSKTVGALTAASTLVAGNAMAELEGEVNVGYSNMYEFRFVDLGNDLIYAGADIAYDMGPIGLSAGAWYGSWDTPGVPGNVGFNSDELDLYAAASYSIGDLSLELGYIYYYFPDIPTGGVSNTQEVYLGASYELPFGLAFGSTFYYDFDQFDGWYWDNNIGYTIEFNECLALELGAGVAFADGHGLQARSAVRGGTGTKDGFQGWYLTAALPWEFREGVTLTPYVKYTDGEGDLATDLYGNGGQEYLVAGVSLAVGF